MTGPTTGAALLGIDLGEKRIGIAIAAAGDLAARPLTTLPRGESVDADAARLRVLAAQHRAGGLVVGLPLEASGAEGPMSAGARAWAEVIGERLGLPVAMRDERLTSHLAEQRLGPMPKGRSGGPPSHLQRTRYRERVDREAAAIILQDHLDAARGLGPRPERG